MSSSSCSSESAGGSSSMARVWMAVRSRPMVTAGVVDEHGGPGREVHADLDVVRVEPAEPLLPGADEEAEHGAARDERQDHHGGAGQQLGHWLAPPGLGDLARLALADRRLEH